MVTKSVFIFEMVFMFLHNEFDDIEKQFQRSNI